MQPNAIRTCGQRVLRRGLEPLQRGAASQRGSAALEFAFVLPTIVILLCGIATFGSAMYSKQLLYDLASETARACVMKNIGNSQTVQACVQSVGNYLASSGVVHQQPCLGQPVQFSSQFAFPSQIASPPYATLAQTLYALEVDASCQFSFAPGFVGVLSETLAKPTNLMGRAAMPWLSDPSPP